MRYFATDFDWRIRGSLPCRQLSSLEEREKELLSKVETIRLLKGNLLKAQVDQIDKATRELNGHARALRDFLNSANDLDFIKAKKALPMSPVRAGELIITDSKSDSLFFSTSPL